MDENDEILPTLDEPGTSENYIKLYSLDPTIYNDEKIQKQITSKLEDIAGKIVPGKVVLDYKMQFNIDQERRILIVAAIQGVGRCNI